MKKVIGMGRTDLGEWGCSKGRQDSGQGFSGGDGTVCKGEGEGDQESSRNIGAWKRRQAGGPRSWTHPVGLEPSVGLNKGAV